MADQPKITRISYPGMLLTSHMSCTELTQVVIKRPSKIHRSTPSEHRQVDSSLSFPGKHVHKWVYKCSVKLPKRFIILLGHITRPTGDIAERMCTEYRPLGKKNGLQMMDQYKLMA